MKKQILYIAAFFVSILAYSQENKELKNNKNSNDEFTYKKIDLSSTDSEELPLGKAVQKAANKNNLSSLARTASSGVGETMGNLSVSLTGGASYDIPISVPPGINGVVPKVSLHYNSQNGNGLAGYGWNLKGTSVISRVASTKHHDGTIDPVDFDNKDRFSLDGKRLVLKSGTYGGNGARYETEMFSNLKITSHGVSPYGASYGPSYFKVHYPDGSIAYYGSTTNSRSRTNYAMTYWQNPQGVRISYEYIHEFNSLSISKIKYGSRNASAPKSEIRFGYDMSSTNTTRGRNEQAYIQNVSFARRNILNSITVYGEGTQYRRYLLYHDNTSLGYTRLTSFKEYSSNNSISHSPIYFNYQDTDASITYSSKVMNLNLLNIEQRNSETRSLDLTGNGKMDFVVYPKTNRNKFWVFKNLQNSTVNSAYEINTGGRFEEIFPVTWLNHSNRILAGQGLAIVKNSTANRVAFNVYSDGTVSSLSYQYAKLWDAPTYTMQSMSNQTFQYRVPQKYIAGDFNGDGLSDAIAIGKPYSYSTYVRVPCDEDDDGDIIMQKANNSNTERPSKPKPDDFCYKLENISVNTSRVHFINLDRRVTNNFAAQIGSLSKSLGSNDKLLTGDANGDGKTDIFHIATGKVYVYTLDANNTLKLLWTTSDSSIKPDYSFLLGDYNGDGKTDFLLPSANQSNSFGMYISTGTRFSKVIQSQPFFYKQTNWNGNNGTLYGYNLIPVDINGDGRTDIIEYNTRTYNNSTVGNQEIKLYNNVGTKWAQTNPGYIQFESGGQTSRLSLLKHFPIPIFLSSNTKNKSLEFASISDKWVSTFQFTQDHREDVLLRSIENNGVTHSIDYNNLDNSEYTDDGQRVYQSTYQESYPNVDLQIASGSKVVTKLQRIVSGTTTLKQTYNYYGAVYNTEGLGFLGFKGVARSNWHTGNSDRMFYVSKHDPLLRGALTQEYTQPYGYSFTYIPSDYISKTSYTNSSSLASNKVFKLKINSSITENRLEGTTITKSFIHDSYNNPTKITTNFSGAGSSVVDITYANSTGSTYYIGRPTKEIETRTIAGNSFSTEKQFSYSGYLLTQKKTKGNGTSFDVETYSYDSFGNITKKITTPNGTASREIRFEYDASGRYLTKTTDIEGLSTTYQYNTAIGTKSRETNAFGQATKYVYDTWNRPIKITDYLGKNMTTSYVESGNSYTVTDLADNGSTTVTTYDALKRVTKVKEKNALGQWVSKSYLYDKFDRLWKESEPYTTGAPTQWNVTGYDYYGRVITKNYYTGKAENITYNGLSVTVDDGVKTVTTTKDAMGNIKSVTDQGGTINYTYFGNGNVKTANYGGSIVSTEQDGWGRKTKTIDPSAGTYSYAYNGFGEIITETTPKGVSEYTYDAFGKITKKRITGEQTDILSNYDYDGTTKLLKKIWGQNYRTSEAYTYEYQYDSHKRPSRTTESNGKAVFDYQVTRDDFGRVKTAAYTSTNSGNGIQSYVRVKNMYGATGIVTEILDDTSNSSLWKLNSINARGQTTKTQLGNGIQKNSTYDAYGLLTDIVHKTAGSSPTIALDIDYNFNRQRGNLISRKNNAFNHEENFAYDSQDRLMGISGAVNRSQTYDSRGRITANSHLGDYAYMSTSSYQLKDIQLNTQGDLHYQNNPIQQIAYNAFKKPVTIKSQGNGRVDFEYGLLENRSHAYYGGNQENPTARRYQKHYSAISPVEIEVNNDVDKTKIITYIGGDAYTAPIVHIKQVGDDIINEYHYLHRDYLGSILAITDANATIKEQRQFGAWGTTDVFKKDGGFTEFDHSTLINRGYTGHEHFFEVGLVHMNGRMYDAHLGRFLAPDNYIQEPFNTQSYNRYGYVWNNPLKYTDPSGEVFEPISFFTTLAYIAFGASAIVGVYALIDNYSQQAVSIPALQNSPSSSNSSQEIATGIPISDPDMGYHLDNPYGVFQSNMLQSTTSSEIAYNTSGPTDSIANGNVIVEMGEFFGGLKDSFNQGIQNFIADSVDFVQNKMLSFNHWSNKVTQTISDIVNKRSFLFSSVSEEYMNETVENISNMSANDLAYAAGYNSPSILLGAAGGAAFSGSLRALGGIRIPVYRKFGGGISGATGEYWSMINPRLYGGSYRNFSGLPDWNTGSFQVKGTVQLRDVFNHGSINPAAPFHGNFGRLVPELRIQPDFINLTHYNGFKLN